MKKSFLLVASALIIGGCTFAQGSDFISSLQNDFTNTKSNIRSDMQAINQQKSRGSNSPLSLQEVIDDVKAERDRELAPIEKQIAQKEALMRNTVVNMKLKASQKKAKLTILQNEISTLKIQKEQIEEKYRKKIQEFRYN